MFIKRTAGARLGSCRLFYIPNLMYRITYRRLCLGLTVEELANKMGINESYIYRVMAGKVEPITERTIQRFAKVLGTLGDPVPHEPEITFSLNDIAPPSYLLRHTNEQPR